MLLQKVLSPLDTEAILSSIPRSLWVDGAITASGIAKDVKMALTLPSGDERVQSLLQIVGKRVEENRAFQRYAIPSRLGQPRFLMYESGMSYGRHLDTVFMQDRRTDLAYTVFLTDGYEGGELSVETTEGAHLVSGGIGDMYIYEAGRIHEVKPVKKGVRVVAVGWVESRIRDHEARQRMFHLRLRVDRFIKEGKNEEILEMQGLYNFLLRRFSSN